MTLTKPQKKAINSCLGFFFKYIYTTIYVGLLVFGTTQMIDKGVAQPINIAMVGIGLILLVPVICFVVLLEDHDTPDTKPLALISYYTHMFKTRKTERPFVMTVDLGDGFLGRSYFCLPIKIGKKGYSFCIKITSIDCPKTKPQKLTAITRNNNSPYVFTDFTGMARVKIKGKCPYINLDTDDLYYCTSDVKRIKTIEQWGTGVREDVGDIKRAGIKINATDTPVTKNPNFK